MPVTTPDVFDVERFRTPLTSAKPGESMVMRNAKKITVITKFLFICKTL
jgi:hypothetical protein